MSSTTYEYKAPQAASSEPVIFKLDENTGGAIQTLYNIVNMTVVSKDASDLRAEYRAGFVQGKLQNTTILSARDNSWDNAYLTDPNHTFPKQHGPASEELDRARDLLLENYGHVIKYLSVPATAPAVDAQVIWRLKRLLFRMLGIYHGVVLEQPASLDFSGDWLPGPDYFTKAELQLGYESAVLSFMDLYFVNAYNDLMDVISSSPELCVNGLRMSDLPDKCSAFLTRQGGDILLTHNSWMGFLSQTMYQTIAVNQDWVTENSASPGLIGSGTDFGYNNKGIMFNETTHRVSHLQTQTLGLWMFWRSALAEQFSSSIQEFFDYISIDNTGTYLNGYMLVDAKSQQTGLVEMSYRCFVYYSSNGGGYSVTCKSSDGRPCSTVYDAEMVTAEYLVGINYPASLQVRLDLQSTDNRPARREQFQQLLPVVKDIGSAKDVITYTAPGNPLSIFGRWDLGYGITMYPKTIPDGSVDAKVASASMALAFRNLQGVFDPSSVVTGFYMTYQTPLVNGKPFIWSHSQWSSQKLRDVPDVLAGKFTLMPLYMR